MLPTFTVNRAYRTSVKPLNKVSMPTACACGFSYTDQGSAPSAVQSQRITDHQKLRTLCAHCQKSTPCVENEQHEYFCPQKKLKCPSCPESTSEMSVEQLTAHFSAMNRNPEHQTIQCGVCEIQIPALGFARHIRLVHNPEAHLFRHSLEDCPWCEENNGESQFSDAELIAHAAEKHSDQYIKLEAIKELSDTPELSPTQKKLWKIIQNYQQRADYQQTLQIQKKSKAHSLSLKAQEHTPGTPYLWQIPHIAKEIERAKENPEYTVQSPSFLTHPNGYKVALILYPNGHVEAENSHLSLYIKIQKSDHDQLLLWPFRPTVTLTVRSQNPRSLAKNISSRFKPSPDKACTQRPLKKENMAMGYSHFVSQSVYKSPAYVQDDAILIECAIDTSNLPYPFQVHSYVYTD